jgi:hypothetical protein
MTSLMQELMGTWHFFGDAVLRYIVTFSEFGYPLRQYRDVR